MLHPADKKTNSSQPLSPGTESIDNSADGRSNRNAKGVDTIEPSGGGFGKWVIFIIRLHYQGEKITLAWTTQAG